MSYDGWVEFNGVELANISRTAQLAPAMGIDTVWTMPENVQWIQDDLGDGSVDYEDVTEAPWYDPDYPASGEFAGIVPLSFAGLDDSTLTSTPVEYITDGGHSGKPRNATLPIVADVAIIASTDRGAEYGKRWLDRLLKGTGPRATCSGSDLRYFRYASQGSPQAHRRDVRLTRGSSVTRKRRNDCSVTWRVTFTMTAADPYEYGEAELSVIELSMMDAYGPGVVESGSIALMETICADYDYTPIFDPLHPALIESPTVPNFLPDGWDLVPGETFDRFWARVSPVEPSTLNVVPIIVLQAAADARMVRVSIWPADTDESEQCNPLFSAILTYIPANMEFTIDGEAKVSYAWDGSSAVVNRTDSLVYGPDAYPVEWTAFHDNSGYLFTLDLLGSESEAGSDFFVEDVRASLSLMPKSD